MLFDLPLTWCAGVYNGNDLAGTTLGCRNLDAHIASVPITNDDNLSNEIFKYNKTLSLYLNPV